MVIIIEKFITLKTIRYDLFDMPDRLDLQKFEAIACCQ